MAILDFLNTYQDTLDLSARFAMTTPNRARSNQDILNHILDEDPVLAEAVNHHKTSRADVLAEVAKSDFDAQNRIGTYVKMHTSLRNILFYIKTKLIFAYCFLFMLFVFLGFILKYLYIEHNIEILLASSSFFFLVFIGFLIWIYRITRDFFRWKRELSFLSRFRRFLRSMIDVYLRHGRPEAVSYVSTYYGVNHLVEN